MKLVKVLLIVASVVTFCQAQSKVAGPAKISGNASSSTLGEQASQAESFILSMGVNVHINQPTYYLALPLVTSTFAALGIQFGRDGMNPSSVGDGSYTNMAAMSAAAPMTFDLVVDRTVWSAFLPFTTADLDGQLAAIGVPAVTSLEGSNEYDLSGDGMWPAHAESFQSEVQSSILADSNPTVAAYPLVQFSLGNAQASTMYVEGQGALATLGNMHSYPGGNEPSTFLGPTVNPNDSYIGLSSLVGPIPTWATETGYNTSSSVDPSQYISYAAQGKYVPRTYFLYFNAGVPRTYIYEMKEESDGWGEFLKADNSVTPAYTYISNMFNILGDPGSSFIPSRLPYALSGSTTNVNHTLLEKRNGRFELVLWQEVSSYNLGTHMDVSNATQSVTVTLGAPFSSWKQYDPSISTTAQSSGTGTTISVTVPDYPVILELVP